MKTITGFLTVLLLTVEWAFCANHTASLTIGGVVHPAVTTSFFLATIPSSLPQGQPSVAPRLMIQCDGSIKHTVIVETGGRRQIVQGEQSGRTTQYVLPLPAVEKSIVTIVSQ